MNLSVLSWRAASRTPCRPLDLRLIRPGVRGKSVGKAFLLAELLSSINSADGSVVDCSIDELSAPSLFADVAVTTDSSEFSLAFVSAFAAETFADRSTGENHRFSLPLETKETSRFSRLECRCPVINKLRGS